MPVSTVADLLLARRGDAHPGLVAGGRTWSWDEVVTECRVRAGVLRRLLVAGEPPHVAVLLANRPDYLFWVGAAALAGAAVVGGNLTRRGDELAADLRHTDSRLLVTDREGLRLLGDTDTGVPPERVLTVDGPGHGQLLASARAELGASGPGWPAGRDERPTEDTPLLLLFTSGSTGAPKAVVCSTGRLARIAAGAAQQLAVTRDDVVYLCMPLFHGNALMAGWAPALGQGATVVLRLRFSASGWLTDVRESGATFTTYVGRALSYLLATPATPRDAEHRLRLAFGTEASARDIADVESRFGCEVLESYGSSEGVVSIQRSPDTPPGALGRPLPRAGSDVVVLDPDTGRECPPTALDAGGGPLDPAAVGEIVDRGGAAVFEGYYANREATTQRLRDGAFWTGDLAYRDTAGWFWFAGRSADWLRVDSENVATAPVERILARHPSVALCAVHAVPDPRTGDQVAVALQLREGATLAAAGLSDFLAAQPDLSPKWLPSFVRVVAAMPVTGTLKADKAPLRRDGWWAPGEVWWRPPRETALRTLTDADRALLRAEAAKHGRTHLLGGK